ncbi:uncharacterized protein LOC114350204 [Ostrinia furnacalis]|uniref:uncharacterized protein LOC114350204 n=1 Tax=Ostrinia furnacalis TaxID=93504 RepID=UPI00103A0ADA|nr:uncharacterized protein LOC114350204 [Ostrinia furnacalis]
MDIKEIIKWFIPCFHILLALFVKMDSKLTFVYLFLFINLCPTFGARVNAGVDLSDSLNLNATKNVGFTESYNLNQSEVIEEKLHETKSIEDAAVGRTFGRPFKKMMAGLLPIIFQIGAASTWAVIATLVGVKTLFVTLVILKLLLVAGAAKAGALFASKGHHQGQGWQPHQKEIHLHIHNGQYGPHPTGHEEHAQTWSRNEIVDPNGAKNPYNIVLEPYGPQTLSTPYGKTTQDSNNPISTRNTRQQMEKAHYGVD